MKGLLDSAGIDSDLTSVDAVQDMFPGEGGWSSWSAKKTLIRPAA